MEDPFAEYQKVYDSIFPEGKGNFFNNQITGVHELDEIKHINNKKPRTAKGEKVFAPLAACCKNCCFMKIPIEIQQQLLEDKKQKEKLGTSREDIKAWIKGQHKHYLLVEENITINRNRQQIVIIQPSNGNTFLL